MRGGGGQTPQEPDLPAGVVDRAADIWEPLIAIADVAGGSWPAQGRAAAVYFTSANVEARTSGVELLDHIKEAFGAEPHIATTTLLDHLRIEMSSPWANIRGKPLDSRGLALRLKSYGIKSRNVRIGERVAKGYSAEDFSDAWKRYCPSASDIRYKGNIRYKVDNENNSVADVADVAANGGGGAVGDGDPFALWKDPSRLLITDEQQQRFERVAARFDALPDPRMAVLKSEKDRAA